MESSIPEILRRYRGRAALLDSNLLLLLVVGSLRRSLIARFKRTSHYSEADFDLLRSFIGMFSVIYTTPNILTEVSNLVGHGGENLSLEVRAHFASVIGRLPEKYVRSCDAADTAMFRKLGLTDAAIAKVWDRNFLVVTDDWPLAGMLAKQQVDVINFNHLRTIRELFP